MKKPTAVPTASPTTEVPWVANEEEGNFAVKFDLKALSAPVRVKDLSGAGSDDDDAKTTWTPSSSPTTHPTANPSACPSSAPTPVPTGLPTTTPTYSVALNGMAMKDDDSGDDDQI
jgi:hypothetical protein